MKTITEIISRNDSPLKNLITEADKSKKLGVVFNEALDKNLMKHCSLANYQNSELTVTVSNASWATRLRYAIPEIIKQLRIQPDFRDITRINYVIATNKAPQPQPKNKISKLSKSNEALWRKTISDLKGKTKLKTK